MSYQQQERGVAIILILVLGCIVAWLIPAQARTIIISTPTLQSSQPGVLKLDGTFSPMSTPAPTATPVYTPTPIQSIPIKGSLIYQASLKYVASTEEEAIRVARSLRFVQNDGHPSNMCGPLAVAILRDAGFVSPDIDLHDFWLLNPRQNAQILESTFPRNQFLWKKTTVSINRFDFKSFPLMTGDLLYLYAGSEGTFEHILVVTRVDDEGRTFTVTNHNTEKGYLIEELMLYDPARPQKGLFYEWTDKQNFRLGLTGYGGFDLWRPRSVIAGSASKILSHSIDETIETYGGNWQILIKDADGTVLHSKNADQSVHIGSVMKIPIALLFLKSLEDQPLPDLVRFLETQGIDGRSYWQLLRAMLVFSEEQATDSLMKDIIQNGLNIEDTLHNWGVENTNVYGRTSTANDIAKLLEVLYDGEFLSANGRNLVLTLMNEYTPSDDLRLGLIRREMPRVQVYNKRGTITTEFLAIADVALVVQGVKRFEIIVLGREDKTHPTTYEHLEQAIGEIARLFGQYMVASSDVQKKPITDHAEQ